MEIGICKLCDEIKELQRSHAIGKSVFKKLLKSSGMNFSYSPLVKNQTIIKTNDQWVAPLLCRNCESILNSKYENYSLWALKNKQPKVKHFESRNLYIIFNIDQYKLALYVISIYWRAAHSTHSAYNMVYISDDWSEYLKKCILGQVVLDFKKISVRISKLADYSGKVGSDGLEGFIASLYPRINYKDGYSYFMMFEGYYFEILFNCLNDFERAKKGIVRENEKILYLPYVDFRSINELFNNMIATKRIAELSVHK